MRGLLLLALLSGGKYVELLPDGGVKCDKPPPTQKVSVKLTTDSHVRDLGAWAQPYLCQSWVMTDAVGSKRLLLAISGDVTAAEVPAIVRLELDALGLEFRGQHEVVEKGAEPVAAGDGGFSAVSACDSAFRDDVAAGTKGYEHDADVDATLVDRLLAAPACLSESLALAKKKDGLAVTAVGDKSLFARIGLKSGDAIASLNDKPVEKASCDALAPANDARLSLIRDGKPFALSVRLKNRKPGPASVRAFCSALLAAVRQ